jgi:Flp pilus assembly protein TadG
MTGFLNDSSASVAAEMALAMPMVLALMFGGLEAGHFLWSEHKAIEGVRAGARYASRLQMATLCPDAGSVDAATVANIKNVARTGKLDTAAAPLVPGWTSAQVTVDIRCRTYVSTGIYTTLGAQGATVKVATANLAYPSLFKALGFITSSVNLNAWTSAPVIGI